MDKEKLTCNTCDFYAAKGLGRGFAECYFNPPVYVKDNGDFGKRPIVFAHSPCHNHINTKKDGDVVHVDSDKNEWKSASIHEIDLNLMDTDEVLRFLHKHDAPVCRGAFGGILFDEGYIHQTKLNKLSGNHVFSWKKK